MGWGLKIGLFVFALVAAGFGAWIIAIPIVAYLLLPLFLPKRKSPREQNPKGGSSNGRGMPVGKLLGVTFVGLSVMAFASGGTLSPIVLAVAGFLILFRPNFGSGLFARVKPVDESILLRGSLVPFRWFAMAEVKFSTRDPQGALSGIDGNLFLVSAPAPRVFLIFSTTSLGMGKAEEEVLGHMRTSARMLGALGVYLLPIDSKAAFELSRLGTKVARAQSGGLLRFVSSEDYGSLLVEARNGYVERFEFHEGDGQGKGANAAFFQPREKPSGSVLLRDLLHAAMERIGTPQPDRYTAFLSSMAATVGETLGQRMIQAAQGSAGQAVLVTSLGSPQVEMSAAQLRFLTNVYS